MSTILPQAISPALGNSLFAASIHQNILGGNLIWLVLLVLCKLINLRETITSLIWILGVASLTWVHSLTLEAPTYDWRETVDHEDD